MEALIVDIENELKFISHKLRRIYTYLISPNKIFQFNDIAMKAFDLFNSHPPHKTIQKSGSFAKRRYGYLFKQEMKKLIFVERGDSRHIQEWL